MALTISTKSYASMTRRMANSASSSGSPTNQEISARLEKAKESYELHMARVKEVGTLLSTKHELPKLDLKKILKEPTKLEKLHQTPQSSTELTQPIDLNGVFAGYVAKNPRFAIEKLVNAESRRQEDMKPVKQMAGQQEIVKQLLEMTMGLSDWAQKH